jgi:3'(2'), 5'-bisphosphate nucleotidase
LQFRKAAPESGFGNAVKVRSMTTARQNHSEPAAVLDAEAMLALLEPLTTLVAEAGAAICAIRRGTLTVDEKSDGSPVTQADLAADRIIAEGLARLCPGVRTLSEERTDDVQSAFDGSFFLIDPLDGTKEFIAGRDEFTVNLAIVTGGVPMLGIVGHGARRIVLGDATSPRTVEPIHTRPHPPAGSPWNVAVSRSHGDPRTEAFIAQRPHACRRVLGSAVKYGHVADGEVDIYPRLSPTSEWDVGAGHALVVAAGGKVTDSQGRPLRFGTSRDSFIVPEFIAWGDGSAMP